MRYRHRIEQTRAMSYGYHINGVEQFHVDTSAPTSAQAMLDFSSGKKRVGRRPYQPCNHVRITVAPGQKPPYVISDPFGFMEPEFHTFDGEYWTYVPNHMINYPDSYVGNIDDLAVPPSVAERAIRLLLDDALDAIPDSVSIANFIWELREVKQLIPKLQSLALAPGQLLLWWQFAVRPLVDDVKKILNLAENLEKRLDHLRKINGRTVTFRRHAHWSQDNFGDTHRVFFPTPGSYDLAQTVEQMSRWDSGQLSIAASVKTDLDFRGIDVFNTAMLAAFGLNNPIKVVWNAIPFSWLVEWFIKLDGFLDTFEIPEFPGTMQILSTSHTVRTKSMFSSYGYTSPPEFGHFPNPLQQSAELKAFGHTLVRGFRRRSGLPPASIGPEGLSLTQQAILAALLQQGAHSQLISRH
jgi:hypothetical protein